MIEIEITDEMINKAKNRDFQAGAAFKGASIENGKGRFYGFLGEEIVHNFLSNSTLNPTKDYDITLNGINIDVKTKTRKDTPKMWYDATVDESATHQNPDFYIFVSILAPHLLITKSIQDIRNFKYKTAWILGCLSKKEFFDLARHFNAGDIDPSNGIKYRDSIYLVKINQLSDIKRIIEQNEVNNE